MLFSIKWWKAASIRAIKTASQAAVAMIGAEVLFSAVDWRMVISAAILAGILSFLTSLGGLPEIDLQIENELPEESVDRFSETVDELSDGRGDEDEIDEGGVL